jgi:hypothetical protein
VQKENTQINNDEILADSDDSEVEDANEKEEVKKELN